jgi:hypothetical protein
MCGGEIVEAKIMMGETHLSCSIVETESPSRTPSETTDPYKNSDNFNNAACCANNYQVLQSTNEFVRDATQIAVNLESVIIFTHSSLYLDLFSQKSAGLFLTRSSPHLIEKDILVLFQTFLN